MELPPASHVGTVLGSLIPAASPDTPAGAALFIKPNVMQTNVEAWASFSKYLQRPGQSSPARWTDR